MRSDVALMKNLAKQSLHIACLQLNSYDSVFFSKHVLHFKSLDLFELGPGSGIGSPLLAALLVATELAAMD